MRKPLPQYYYYFHLFHRRSYDSSFTVLVIPILLKSLATIYDNTSLIKG